MFNKSTRISVKMVMTWGERQLLDQLAEHYKLSRGKLVAKLVKQRKRTLERDLREAARVKAEAEQYAASIRARAEARQEDPPTKLNITRLSTSNGKQTPE